ncbi:aldo/keto reductase [Streptomyces sp. 4N509B]|uniref:aldo/keto reductase n=1 Tax=Streptomyces sp. 4N509B TaxID=3457413 RepID=UPI003FD4DF9F
MALSRLDPRATPVARVGLGLAAVGRPGYINLGRRPDLPADRTVAALRERTHELLDAAHAAGVRYVDAARSYGRAEEFLGDWLRAHPEASDLVVGSKWGYTYVGEWRTDAAVHEVKDHAAATFDRQYPETRDLLGERLDLYQIHSVTPDSPVLQDPAVVERLRRLADSGVSVGLSTSGPDQAAAVRAALRITHEGRPLFTAVQSTFNALETSAGPALAEAHAAGLTVIVKEAMANGRLAVEPPDALRRVTDATGAAADTLALAFALHQPWVTLVLSGAATVAQLSSNLAAPALRLSPEQVATLAALAEPPETYWRRRSELAWA